MTEIILTAKVVDGRESEFYDALNETLRELALPSRGLPVVVDDTDDAGWSFSPAADAAPRTCILTGADGENPDDCTTHDHEGERPEPGEPNLRDPRVLESLYDGETWRRLDYLRSQLRDESISMGEIAELQSLAPFIEPGDVELLEPAGVPEEFAFRTYSVELDAANAETVVADAARHNVTAEKVADAPAHGFPVYRYTGSYAALVSWLADGYEDGSGESGEDRFARLVGGDE